MIQAPRDMWGFFGEEELSRMTASTSRPGSIQARASGAGPWQKPFRLRAAEEPSLEDAYLYLISQEVAK